jgi:hypothetical protein
MTHVEYQSGTCNIDRSEARKRYTMGAAGFLSGAGIIGLIYSGTLPSNLTPAVSIPLFAGFLGVLQGYLNFCAGFGMKGVESTGKEPEQVDDAEGREKDRRRSLEIVAASAALSAAVTLVAMLA